MSKSKYIEDMTQSELKAHIKCYGYRVGNICTIEAFKG